MSICTIGQTMMLLIMIMPIFKSLDVDEDNGYILNENLFVYIYNDLDYGAAYINIYSIAAEADRKAEIDPLNLTPFSALMSIRKFHRFFKRLRNIGQR